MLALEVIKYMNGIERFQAHYPQKSKKKEDKNNFIVVSNVLIILEKNLEYFNNSNNSTTRKKNQKTPTFLFFSGGEIRLVFIKTKYVQYLRTNLTMWAFSSCPRILQDHEFNGEQNDELCLFHSRTSSLINTNKLISCQKYQKEKGHLISFGTYYDKKRKKGFDNGLKKGIRRYQN